MATSPLAGSDGVVQLVLKRNGAQVPDAWQIVEVVVDLDLTRPSMFILKMMWGDLASGNQDAIPVDIGDELEILPGYDTGTASVIKGEVTTTEWQHGTHGSYLIVRGLDKSHRLQRQRKYRAFLNKSDSDIARTLAGEAGLSANATGMATVHKFIAQVNQTDWEFLRWRAEENGRTLNVSDGNLNLVDRSTDTVSVLSYTLGGDVISFRTRMSAPPVGTVTAQAWDSSQKTAFTATQTVSAAQIAQVEKSPSALKSTFGEVTHLSTRRTAEGQPELQDHAKALATRFADSFVEAEIVSQGSALAVPGAYVDVKGASPPFNGKYRITVAKHVIAGGNWLTTVRCVGLEDHSLLGLTNGANPSETRVPRMEGVVPAIVTNVNDPDSHHRIKVKFPWLDDGVESDWIRTVQYQAGNGWGSTFLPEVGDEVVVAFEQGDFRRGYVLGGVYNALDKPAAKIGGPQSGGKVSQRGYQSVKGHRLVFDEEQDGKSGIHLMTGDDQLEIYMDKQNTKITIDCKNGKVEIHGAQDVSIKSDANVKIEATGSLEMKGTAGVKIESPATMDIKGASTTVKGDAKLDLNGGGMASLSGGLVKIN